MAKKVIPRKKIAFNTVEGQFSLVNDNNFSYEAIPSSDILAIEENHQMLIHEQFELEENSELHLDGSLIMEE
jgi:hypothetical protein